ncbi:unnamed protein product [Linum trigynum]|uniref:Uncharacterized protein n=1 Tax=Linum trigynum TaxID=586398 RepID=A0AAV2CWS7_9ROSI
MEHPLLKNDIILNGVKIRRIENEVSGSSVNYSGWDKRIGEVQKAHEGQFIDSEIKENEGNGKPKYLGCLSTSDSFTS